MSAKTRTTSRVEPLDASEDTAPRYFVGVEGSLNGVVNRSGTTFDNRTDLSELDESAVDRLDGRISAGIVLSGDNLQQRAFLLVGATPFAERTIKSSYNRSSQSADVVEQLSTVDPVSGTTSSSVTVVRSRRTATQTNSKAERIEMHVEPWAGVGYRIDMRVGGRYRVGLEAIGGAGPEFIHAGFSLPLSYLVGRTIHLEIKPNLHYVTQHSSPEEPTPGTSLSDAGSTSFEAANDDARLSAGIGVGFVLFVD
jgi:hypothetical protein